MATKRWKNKGRQSTSHLTVNGRVSVQRTVYWNRQDGTRVPLDLWLGIDTRRFSPGIREMCSRESLHKSFHCAATDLGRTAQIRLSKQTLRKIIHAEGHSVARQQRRGQWGPDWTATDCRDAGEESCSVITGADGVMVPLVTEVEKAKRRASRRKKGPKARCRRRGIRRGSDQSYKEFKIVAFYDPSHTHQYAAGTSGDCNALGRLMRRLACRIKLDQADVAYSVSDGAKWILRQYNQQLPMLKVNILDYYHLRDHVIAASYCVFGDNTPEATAWREEMMGVVLDHGALALLDRIGELRRSLRAKGKRAALESLRQYVASRVDMLAYPAFRAEGLDIGSGPTEAFCKTLTSRLKGPGMRWDKPHAEGMMALASIYSSGMWNAYWTTQRQAA